MSWKHKRVLVTGAAGFIGSYLAKRLVAEGAQVNVILKKHTSRWRIENILDQLVTWDADLTDSDSLRPIFSRFTPEVIFHLAAHVDVTWSWDIISPMIQNNITGTINLLATLRDSQFDAFVYAGTCEEYGHLPSPIKEGQRESPISPYSFSKLSSTIFCQMVANTLKLPIVMVRIFPTYGPLQEGPMLIPSAIRELLLNKKFKMSTGEQKREFTYIDDVVEALLKVAVCAKAGGELLNIGSGIPYKVKDVIEIIRECIEGEVAIELGTLPLRRGEGMEFFCSNQKLQELTGWSPKVSLREGLRLTVEWYKTYYKTTRAIGL